MFPNSISGYYLWLFIIKSEFYMDKIEEYTLKSGLRPITEGGLNRIMFHGRNGFIVISANRSEIYSSNSKLDLTPTYIAWCKSENANPSDKQTMDFWLRQRNKEADQELHDRLKSSKYAFTPVYGGYHGTDDVQDSFEPSYIVYNHAKNSSKDYLDWEDLYKFALELTRDYKQDSVYIQAPDKAPIYVNGDGEKTNSRESKNFKFNDYTQTYFTTAKREKRSMTDEHGLETKPQRFTADIQFENIYKYCKAGPSTYFDRMKRSKLGEVFPNDKF